jgi:hypothetical protein
MKKFLLVTTLVSLSGGALADPVVATSVRRGDTVVTTTSRGVYTTEIQRNSSGATSETRFRAATPPADRNAYRPMTH